MGRIFRDIDFNGRHLWTLFDSGARNTYVAREATPGMELKERKTPLSDSLGGETHEVRQTCVLTADIDGHEIETLARVVDRIGKDESGHTIDVLLGALTMQEWGIRLDLPNEQVDLSHYTTSFVEFGLD